MHCTFHKCNIYRVDVNGITWKIIYSLWTEYEFKEHLRLSRQTALQLISNYLHINNSEELSVTFNVAMSTKVTFHLRAFKLDGPTHSTIHLTIKLHLTIKKIYFFDIIYIYEACKCNTYIHMIVTDEYETSKFMPNNLYGIRPIPGRLNIYILLWFMANTEPLRTISDRFDVSISSVFRIIRRLIAWLLTKTDEIITWPQHEKVLAVCERFFSKRRIPQVIGAIDCTPTVIDLSLRKFSKLRSHHLST